MKQGPRILLIDNKPWWSEFSKKVLSKHGYRVDRALDEEGALKKLDSQKYDMVVMDFYVSGTDGVTSLKRILEKHPEEKVVVVSAAPSWKEGRDVFRVGAFDYLSKSLEKTQLLKTIREGLKIKNPLSHNMRRK
ncbi:MAG: response regulator [bacterium]